MAVAGSTVKRGPCFWATCIFVIMMWSHAHHANTGVASDQGSLMSSGCAARSTWSFQAAHDMVLSGGREHALQSRRTHVHVPAHPCTPLLHTCLAPISSSSRP